MFEKYKEGDLITVKLSSGEEVIGKFKGIKENLEQHWCELSIEKSLVLMQGPQGLAFATFFSTAEQTKPISIALKHVLAISYINDKIKTEYERIFSTVKVPDKPKIIV